MAAGFMFATGIENSYPTIQLPDGSTKGIDEMEKAHFYQRWKEDFALLDELGIRHLRFGPPYYKVHLASGKYDWSATDQWMYSLKDQDITVIADLCHFGVPDWIGNFQNPDFPRLFAEYAEAFAARY